MFDGERAKIRQEINKWTPFVNGCSSKLRLTAPAVQPILCRHRAARACCVGEESSPTVTAKREAQLSYVSCGHLSLQLNVPFRNHCCGKAGQRVHEKMVPVKSADVIN